jgi:hypothetical protein
MKNHFKNDLFLISPPGSFEAKGMGYINIPKIIKTPPPGLFAKVPLDKPNGLHYFTDGAITEMSEEIKANFDLSLSPSNTWILKEAVESEIVARKIIVPIIPEMTRDAIKWIVCEYALDCTLSNDERGLNLFIQKYFRNLFTDIPTDEIPHEELGDFKKRVIEFALSQNIKGWRNAKTPIAYLKTIFKREGLRERERSRPLYLDVKLKYGKKILSFSQPVVTGEDGKNNELTLDYRLKNEFEDETADLNREEDIDFAHEICKSARLTPITTKLFTLTMQSFKFKTYAEAAAELKMTTKEYKRALREIDRNRDNLRKAYLRLKL